MIVCRRSRKLAISDRVTHFLLQAFCSSDLRGQHGDRAWVPREEVRHVYTSAQSECPDSMGRAELLPVRHSRISKLPGKPWPGTKSRSLLRKLTGLSDVKEDVFGALDEWAAFELEFPLVATRMALERLRKEQQWHRVIQVTKWMFSKGIGKTHGSYGLLLKAYCRDGRLDEAEELWNSLISMNDRSMPKILFAFMTSAYRRQKMPEKIIKVFEQMESFNIKPDKDMLQRVGEAYQQLNMPEKVEELGKRYAIDSKTRRKEKRLKQRKARKTLKLEQLADQAKENASLEYQTDGDEEDAEKQLKSVQANEGRASFSTEETPNRYRSLQRGSKSESTSTAEDEFVKQVIDTM